MTDKEMIEEMAKDMCEGCDFPTCVPNKTCISWIYAKNAVEQGYRKIPEGAVVLTREEYERFQRIENTFKRFSMISPTEAELENKALKETIGIVLAQKRNIWQSYNKLKEEFDKMDKQARKETAKEILAMFDGRNYITEKLKKDIAKKCGVEVEE